MSDYGSEEGMDKLFAKMRQNISARELICDHADECQKMRSEGGPMSKIKHSRCPECIAKGDKKLAARP